MALLIPYLGVLLKAALVTLKLSSLSLLLAVMIGVVMGMIATSRVRAFRTAVRIYVEIVRSVPLLVLLFFAYYALPLLTSIKLAAYPAAVISLSPTLRTILAGSTDGWAGAPSALDTGERCCISLHPRTSP